MYKSQKEQEMGVWPAVKPLGWRLVVEEKLSANLQQQRRKPGTGEKYYRLLPLDSTKNGCCTLPDKRDELHITPRRASRLV